MSGGKQKPPSPPAPPRPDTTDAAGKPGPTRPRGYSSTLLTQGLGNTSPGGIMKTLLGQ